MTTTKTATCSIYATTYHRDGKVTLWDVYAQRWVTTSQVRDEVLASLPADERQRVIRHLATAQD